MSQMLRAGQIYPDPSGDDPGLVDAGSEFPGVDLILADELPEGSPVLPGSLCCQGDIPLMQAQETLNVTPFEVCYALGFRGHHGLGRLGAFTWK